MSFMNYCRFELTTPEFQQCLSSLCDCVDNGHRLSESEEEYADRLFDLALDYVTAYRDYRDFIDDNEEE